jgi:hypothetical protein
MQTEQEVSADVVTFLAQAGNKSVIMNCTFGLCVKVRLDENWRAFIEVNDSPPAIGEAERAFMRHIIERWAAALRTP